MIDYATTLRELGYQLRDCGAYWQTAALFRGGDNQTALRIWKNSGRWTDFVESKSGSFESLIRKTTGKSSIGHIIEYNLDEEIKPKILLKEEKTFSAESLKKLLPDYTYWNKRGIPTNVLKEYRCGLATGGKLYQRIVFPIFRRDGKIHGFSGRKVNEENDRPKWLHYGKSADWFYPYFSIDYVREKIEEENRIFVVESIGDSMSLYRSGVENNIVAFTNKINAKLIARLAATGADICLSFNNDSEGQNRGFDGALTSLLRLIDCVDITKIWFTPPKKNDFGAMNDTEVRQWRDGLIFDEEEHKNGLLKLKEYAPQAILPKCLEKNFKRFEELLKEL